jgi:hypothetical protein
VVSIVDDGDIYIENNIGPSVINGNTALTVDNKIVPKHTVVLPFLAVPFYIAFGPFGLFIFNCVQFGLLAYLIFALNRLVFDRWISSASTATCFLGSFLLFYIPNFSPDILATVFVLGALWLIQAGRGAFGLFLGGLSLFVKIYNAIPLALLCLMYVLSGGRSKTYRVFKGALATLLGLLPMFVFNSVYFGSPFIGGYNRTVDGPLADGMWSTMSHTSTFNLPIWPGLWNILFDAHAGYLSSAPIVLVGLMGCIRYLFSKNKPRVSMFAFAFLINVIYILLFAKYFYWNMSNFGNRFLMLPLALSSLFVGFLFKTVMDLAAQHRTASLCRKSPH